MASSSKRPASGRQQASRARINRPVGLVRIIGGQWRGRKLAVADVAGLRPTGDRVRETLFNWLQAHIAGAHCLDLFAGTGVLGFEALSRHASSVTWVEPDSTAVAGIYQIMQTLNIASASRPSDTADQSTASQTLAHLHTGSAADALDRWHRLQPVPEFDLVFIDPPFDMACQWHMLELLVPTFLADSALVYIESPRDQAAPAHLPAGCEVIREKAFGEVVARLISFVKLT